MNEKNIMSEEAFNELINGFEFVETLTKYGRKNIKYHIQKLQQENKRLYELCMYALISSTKIYNHELAINTKQAFIQIIKENLQEDTFTIRDKIKKYWEIGDSNE